MAAKAKEHQIELIRIIACFLVIMAHSQIVVMNGINMDYGRLVISTAIADDVPLFLLVTGFLFFGRVKSNEDIAPTFSYKIKSFFTNIYIPTILYILISIFFRHYNSTATSLANADWNYLVRFIFRLAPGDHLWYICTYMSFVFFFPMLAFVCQDAPEKNKLRRTLLLISLTASVIADVQYFFRWLMLDIDRFLWGYCTILLILGYELSLFIKKWNGSKFKLALYGIAIYLIGFSIKFGLQIYMFHAYNEINNRFRWLQCTPCFVTAIGLFILVYAIGTAVRKESVGSRLINFFGSCTFAIYLFHFLVIIQTGSWRQVLFTKFSGCNSFATVVGYYAIYATAVFFTTFVIAYIFKLFTDNTVKRLLGPKPNSQR